MTDRTPDTDTTSKKWVAVFGAGITGLTAAHELIERGYCVEVYEAEAPSPFEQVCGIGGMAATQWVRVEHLSKLQTDKSTPGPLGLATAAPGDALAPVEQLHGDLGNLEVLLEQTTIQFPKGGTILDRKAKKSLDNIANQLNTTGSNLRIEIRGYTHERHRKPYDQEKGDDLTRAQVVSDYLAKKGGVKEDRLTPINYGLGYPDDWKKTDKERCFVNFRTIEDWVPGEHGFRFFPAFYRNLRDTMSRTPIAETQEEFIETPWTTEDNIIATTSQGINPEGGQNYVLPRKRVTSPQQMFDALCASLAGSQYTFQDLALIQVKLFKYITSCPERRCDYENLSWWDFVEGDRYSASFKKYLDKIPQNLVAMKATECDARTYGNIQTQILLGQFDAGQRADGTLNGPTSLAWLDHWRRYLESQGVIFRRGQLTGFEVLDPHTAWPRVDLLNPDGSVAAQEIVVRAYYVIAIPLEEIYGLVSGQPELAGDDFAKIRATHLGNSQEAKPNGVLQHMSGIQYYLQGDMKGLRGHIVYADSDWGLSSIFQTQFWMHKRGWWDGYHGVLSVDISDWHTMSRHLNKCAWECTREEIAEEVWHQIKVTIPGGTNVPKYVLYHIDDCIEFGSGQGARKVPCNNDDRMLVNHKGLYASRPGKPGHYKLQHGRFVLAGTYMQTYFRLTTMEAANESARHAVNAILDKDRFRGDRCETNNPEDNEFEDLKIFVDLDRELRAQGLPHVVDILGLDALPGSWLEKITELSRLGLSLPRLY